LIPVFYSFIPLPSVLGQRRGVVLALVGSVSDITMEQLRYLKTI
jgi:hypothetical protein